MGNDMGNQAADKANDAVFKYICGVGNLVAEIHKASWVGVRNLITDWKTKRALKMKGSLNNYYMFSVQGLDSQRTQALLGEYKIEGDIVTDKEAGMVAFTVHKKDIQKLLQLEKDLSENKVDIEKIYQEYIDKNGVKPLPDYDHLEEELSELQEEEPTFEEPENSFEEPDDSFEEPDESLSEDLSTEEALDSNADFTPGEEPDSAEDEKDLLFDTPDLEEEAEPEAAPAEKQFSREGCREQAELSADSLLSAETQANADDLEITESDLNPDKIENSVSQTGGNNNPDKIAAARDSNYDYKDSNHDYVEENPDSQNSEYESGSADNADLGYLPEETASAPQGAQPDCQENNPPVFACEEAAPRKRNEQPDYQESIEAAAGFKSPDNSASEDAHRNHTPEHSCGKASLGSWDSQPEHSSYSEDVSGSQSVQSDNQANTDTARDYGESAPISRSNQTYYRDNTVSVHADREAYREAYREADREAHGEAVSGRQRVQPDHEKCVDSMGTNQNSNAEAQKEREICERKEVIQKEYENKKQRENINSVEIGTGAALFTAYAGDITHIAEKQKNIEQLENIRNARSLNRDADQTGSLLPAVSPNAAKSSPFIQQESPANLNSAAGHKDSFDKAASSSRDPDIPAGDNGMEAQTRTQPEMQAGSRVGSQIDVPPEKQTERQTERQTEKKAERQTDRQTERQTEKQTGFKYGDKDEARERAETISDIQSEAPANQTAPDAGRQIENSGIRIDRMELINRYHSSITKGIVLLTGQTFFSAAAEDYRGSVYGQGKAEYSGISAWTANRGYKALGKSRENVYFKRMNKLYNKEPARFKLINDLLQKNGYAKMNFLNRKTSKQSMESFYKVLQKSGLASCRKEAFYQKATWDLTKFNAVIRRCEKKNDFSELARMLHISNSNPLEWKSLGVFMKKAAKLNQYRFEKLKSGKSLRTLITHSFMKETDILKGYLQTRQTVRSIKSVYKAAKLAAILLGKSTWGAATFAASLKILQNTAFSYEVLRINNYVKNRRVYKEEKKNLKETQKAAKRTDRRERKQQTKIRKKTKREAVWNRHVPGFLKTNSILAKSFGFMTAKLRKGFTVAKNIFSKFNPLKLIGLKNVVKTKLLIIGALAGGIFLLLCFVFILISTIISSILSFFSGDSGTPKDVYESSMGKTLAKLQKAEEDWAYKLKNDTKTIVLTDYNIRCGPSYVPIEEYKPEDPGIRDYWEEHNVQWTDNGFTANPFGNFELADQGELSNIYYVDGGVELGYLTKDGSSRISNIKEILCMADVFFGMDTGSEDAGGKGSTADASVNISQSGLTYAHSNEAVTVEEKDLPSGIFWDYCQNLFNISHQEQIDFSYIILPTCYTGENTSAEDAAMQEINDSDITYCPQGDQGGCRIYDNFYYDQNTLCVKDIDGVFHSIGATMPLRDDNSPFVEGEANTEVCSANNLGELINAYESNPGCWEVKEEDECREYCEADMPAIQGITTSIPSGILGAGETLTSAYGVGDDFIIESQKAEFFKLHTEYYWTTIEITLPNGAKKTIGYYKGETHTDYKLTTCTYKLSHSCAGGHHGRYCGGHLKADITGIVCGFTEEQIEGNNGIKGVVEKGSFKHTETDQFTVKNLNGIYAANNLFEADNCVVHSSEPKSWKGWTRDNMELALIKYNMDWEELYGLHFGSSLGGQLLSQKSRKEILEQIKSYHPDLSDERVAVIEDALGWVGNIGYDQRHHRCPLAGPCIYHSSGACGMSDCSGFTSYLWRDRLGGIYTTASFYGIRDGMFHYDLTQPGDILLHYRGTVADGREDHALLYLGYFEYNGRKDFWSIDCSTVDGIGGVFLRHRNYYESCYYVSPDN